MDGEIPLASLEVPKDVPNFCHRRALIKRIRPFDGNKHAEPGHCGSSVLSAAAEVFLPNDAEFVNKLASSARQHTRAMKAHADPQKAILTDLFWPPDVQVDADPALPEAT